MCLTAWASFYLIGKVVTLLVTMIEKVANMYGIYPRYMEQISPRLFKVNDGRYDYALKKSKLTEETIPLWEHVFHQAYKLSLRGVLPVYLTKESNLYASVDGVCYYMMPWMQRSDLNHEQHLRESFNMIGEIHAETRQAQSPNATLVDERFRDYRSQCQNQQQTLLDFVQQFEQNRFMSPFELQVCTDYHVLTHALTELDRQIDRFLDAWEEDHHWNVNLCHGHLQSDHILGRERLCIVNWEDAHYDHAVTDLVPLLQEQVRYYDQSTEKLAQLFSSYEQKNPLTTKEWHFLMIHLLDVSRYIQLVTDYRSAQSRHSMIMQQQKLLHTRRQLQLGLDWSLSANNDSADDQEYPDES
ncbi:spore coat protein YsxE [Lentibacillus halophilus]|uniref:Spore coat protein YsxE n=1 Tax=Lentibacillus halophilus TaxID=295065 RepID=A0ABP3J8L8_9BACI